MSKLKNRKRKIVDGGDSKHLQNVSEIKNSPTLNVKSELNTSEEKPNILTCLLNSKVKKVNHILKHSRDIDVFASASHSFKAQFECCRKIIKKQLHHPNSKGATLWIHGIGKSHSRAINLALKLTSSSDYPDQVKQSIFTDTEPLNSIEILPNSGELQFSEKVVIHIKLEFSIGNQKQAIFSDNKD